VRFFGIFIMVEFREIERFPGYRFGSDGSIWSKRQGTWRQRKFDFSSRYPRLQLLGISTSLRVHLLIAEAFHGPKPPGSECRHLDDNRFNNNPSNLEYGTRRQNNEDALRNGKLKSLLTDSQVIIIVEMLSTHNNSQIGRMFGVAAATIRDIRRGVTWKWIPRQCEQSPCTENSWSSEPIA